MRKFWKWAVILMTAAMAAGMATSCKDKEDLDPENDPEEEPVTIRKTWLAYFEEGDSGYYTGYDFGAINGKICFIECFVSNEEMAKVISEALNMVVTVNDIVYVTLEDEVGTENIGITETDATNGIIYLGEKVTMVYRELTADSVVLIPCDENGNPYEDDKMEFRTPEGWGFTVNNYVEYRYIIAN